MWFLSTDDGVMPILRVAQKVSGEDFADTIVGQKEELVKGAENLGIGFKVATTTISKS